MSVVQGELQQDMAGLEFRHSHAVVCGLKLAQVDVSVGGKFVEHTNESRRA